MVPQVRRGKWLFVVLAAIIVLEQLAHLGVALSSELAGEKWFKAVLRPVVNVFAVYFLWKGHEWLRWAIGVLYVLTGAPIAYVSARVLLHLSGTTPPESADLFRQMIGFPIGLICIVGLLYILVGMPFLVSPSLLAYIRSRKERPRVETPSD